MTAATLTRTRTARSAYPAAVDDLIPLAREYAVELGKAPTRNQLMKRFRVGAMKAKALLAALEPAPAETASPLPPSVEPAPAEPAPPLPADVEDPADRYYTDAELFSGPDPEPFSVAIDAMHRRPGDGAEVGIASDVASVPGETAGTDTTEVARKSRSGAVVALVTSAAATVTGAIVVAHTPPSAVQQWPWALFLAAGLAALATLGVLAWSTASVFGRLLSGRTARDVALDLASWTVAGVAGFLAAYGQIRFAQWAGVTGNMRFLVPGILEPSVVVLLLLANRRVKRRRAGYPAKPIGKLLALAAVLGGFAVYTNVVHAGGRAGLVFGAATVVGLILWWVKLQDDAAPDDWDDAPQSKRLSRRTSRYRLLRWVILPGQTRRAWLISLDHSIADAEIGLDMARRWRRAYDQSHESGVSRRLARRYASRQIDAYVLEQQ